MKEFRIAKENSLSYIVNEVVVGIKNILRKYPNKWMFDQCLPEMCSENEKFNEPEAKAAFFWMLGEFGSYITSPWEILKARSEKY